MREKLHVIEGLLHDRWSQLNEKTTIEELQTNTASRYWDMCDQFVQHIVNKYALRFSHLTKQDKEDAAQDAMDSAAKGIASFQHKSKFTTWLATIAQNRTIDI